MLAMYHIEEREGKGKQTARAEELKMNWSSVAFSSLGKTLEEDGGQYVC